MKPKYVTMGISVDESNIYVRCDCETPPVICERDIILQRYVCPQCEAYINDLDVIELIGVKR